MPSISRKDGLKCLTAIVAALLLAFSLSFATIAFTAPDAYAKVHVASEREASESDASASSSDSQDQAATGEDGEEISDEDTPMASGLGSEPVTRGGNLHWFIIAGIALVAVFYLTSTHRLNRSIKLMESKFK